MNTDPALDELFQHIWTGGRIGPDDALRLFRLPLPELSALADRRRRLAKADAYDGHGNEIITYSVDRNINYTNICSTECRFCAFHRKEGDRDGYVITTEEMDRKIQETLDLGGTQILLQGGHHPGLPLSWYLDLLSRIKTKFPSVNIHGFSPPEFIHFQKLYNLPLEELLKRFMQAGLGSIPGGGAEILVDAVRARIAPRKAAADEWMAVMDAAHRLGLNTSATMMFGHVETLRDRIEHLDRLRRQQDATGGFTAFICWTFQPENTRLPAHKTGGCDYLRTQAVSRIYLDNFPNVQSSWVTQGPEIGQTALKFGANDLGSVMIEENVVSSAGTRFKMTVEEMRRLIGDLGYQPRQRDNWYRLVESVSLLRTEPGTTTGLRS